MAGFPFHISGLGGMACDSVATILLIKNVKKFQNQPKSNKVGWIYIIEIASLTGRNIEQGGTKSM